MVANAILGDVDGDGRGGRRCAWAASAAATVIVMSGEEEEEEREEMSGGGYEECGIKPKNQLRLMYVRAVPIG